jgi:RNA polymerase sigma factor (sigma-70 family)
MMRLLVAGVTGMATKRSAVTALSTDDPIPPEDHFPAPGSETIAGLYRTHRSGLTRYIRGQASRERAPDLLHQLFTRLLSLAPDKRAAIASPEAYLKTSARNIMRDERKAALRQSTSLHISDVDAQLTAPCQIAALEARDMLGRIEAAMRKLKPVTREIFLAHRLDGYSYAEIAERTGLSMKGVEKHMSRAIAHLDRTLSRR